MRPGIDFLRFFVIFGGSCASQNRPQNAAIRTKAFENRCSKKKTFFNIICSCFFIVLASKNEANITIFSDMFRKRRFCKFTKTIEKAIVFLDCSRSESPEIDEKSIPKRIRKNIAKNDPKIDFGVRVYCPKPPKIAPKSRKIVPRSDAERSLFRDAMEIAKKSSKVTGT